MGSGFVTPTHLLFMLAAVAAFVVLSKLPRGGSSSARGSGSARDWSPARSARSRLVARMKSLRLKKPSRAQAHVVLLLVSALVSFAFTRAVALPLFLLVFFALWLCGYGVLARLYR
jgi:hypothetical protein